MSYNYDVNPWDDNYGTSTTNTTSQQQGGYSGAGYGGYAIDGYSNPMAQDSDTDLTNQQQQQQQYQQKYPTDEQQQQQQQSTAPANDQQQPTMIGRFLRQHVPFCGTFMDTMSSINLPFIDALVQHINRDLLVSKMFYFFFYSAFGSLFPLMGVYFKQLGMNPAQVGILTGVRPFIEIFSAPFWHSLAERFHKSKALLLFSLLSWIVFTYSLAHIRPPASACVAFNDTYYVLYTPYSANDLSNADVGNLEEPSGQESSSSSNEMFLNKMPERIGSGANPKEKEGKDEILASEENQNDQKKRRRKRHAMTLPLDYNGRKLGRSIADNKRTRHYYSVDGDSETLRDDGLNLDVDLESDFDDKLISNNKRAHKDARLHIQGSTSLFELENVGGNDEAPEYDELEQLYSEGSSHRHKRSVSMKDLDDLLGESDESDPAEESEGNREGERVARERSTKEERNGGSGSAGEEEGEGDEEEVAGGGEESEGKGGYNNIAMNGKKDRGTGKHNQPASSQAQVTTTTTTTTAQPVNEPTYESSSQQALQANDGVINKTKRVYKQRHKTPPTHIVGMSPITVEYAVNYNKEKHSQFVTPMFSTIVYKLDDIKEVFFLLLLLISLGEFFSAPALTLADSATLGYLGDNTDLYGRQRMFGSFSWAVTLLLVGMALDNATSIADHPCGPHQRERSYTVCFIIFSLLMACAFLTATQFRFNYPQKSVSSTGGGNGTPALVAANTNTSGSGVTTSLVDGTSGSTVGAGNIDEIYAATQPRSIFNTAPPVNAPPPTNQQGNGKEKFEFLDKWKSAVFAQRTWDIPEWVNVFRQFRNSLHLMYLFITWFLGCGVGLVFTFLFWHLQDVGGTPTLFGICSVINHISEILAYFFSFSFIKRFGHTRVSIRS